MIVIQFDVESGTRMSHPYAQMPANVVSDLSPEWRRDLLPGDILRRIYSNGFHPFIVLRRADIHPAPVEICSHQNDMEAFTTVLTDWAGHSRFIRGLQHAIKSEPYEAAFAFFDWIFDPEDIGNAYLYDQHEYPFPGYFDYPILEVGGSGPIFAVDKVDLLADVFDAYQKSKGNDRLRFAILEALGFALSRGMGAIGQYTRALEFVGRALSAQPKSFYLPMCLYAFEQKINASSVPVRLEKFLNHDLHALDSVVCPLPFTRLEITPDGYAHVCCASLVPYTIGNIEENSIPQIMNSENARKMRASILDGSYRYCDHVNCPQMIRDKIPKKTDPEILEDPVLGRAVMAGDLEINEIRELTFGYDWSCNLSCPSCRRETIIDHHMQSSERENHIKQNIVPLLSRLRLLYINNAGEFLFSRPSRELLKSINPITHAGLTIDLISNGTLFSEQEWRNFHNIHGLVRKVRISTDAATKETFELLRRGGNWEGFVDNVRFIGTLRRRADIDVFMLAFTHQLQNFREMPAFVGFGECLGADVVSFERLLRSTESMSDGEYCANAVHLRTHPLHSEFLEALKHPLMSAPIVICDFE